MPLLPEIRIVFSQPCSLDSTSVRRVSQGFVVKLCGKHAGEFTISPETCWDSHV